MILHGLPLLGAPISGEDSRLVAAWDELPTESQRKILENLEILTSESSDEWVPGALIFQFLPLPTEVLSHLAICASLQWSIPKPKLFQYFWIGTVTFTSLWVPALQKMGSCQSTRHAVLQWRWYRYKMVQVHTSTSCFDSINCAFFWVVGWKLARFFVFLFLPSGSTSLSLFVPRTEAAYDAMVSQAYHVSLTILSMIQRERSYLPRGFSTVWGWSDERRKSDASRPSVIAWHQSLKTAVKGPVGSARKSSMTSCQKACKHIKSSSLSRVEGSNHALTTHCLVYLSFLRFLYMNWSVVMNMSKRF